MTQLKLEKRHEWIQKTETFGVIVSCFEPVEGSWTWTMYALIYDNHPLFTDVSAAVENLPWHCGCTYDKKFTIEPARGIRYDWQRKSEYYKIGCDYAHLYDDLIQSMSPEFGIPRQVMDDAKNLFDALLGYVEVQP